LKDYANKYRRIAIKSSEWGKLGSQNNPSNTRSDLGHRNCYCLPSLHTIVLNLKLTTGSIVLLKTFAHSEIKTETKHWNSLKQFYACFVLIGTFFDKRIICMLMRPKQS